MEKITELTSTDVVQHNIEKLKELFPTAVSEGKLLVEELQALMGEYIEKDKEYYQMTWAGKTEAQKEANKVSTGTLRPAKDESKDWDTTGNIVIEGDNLEVLKLLQKTYSNEVKMIYIDPPYNTGNDFVYKDNYKDNLSHYLELTGQTDEEGKKLSSNTDSDGRYHSNWLNMMYPRLKLARNLLTDDGVIFISIDDHEYANLKKMCDEIFGEENYVGDFIKQSKVGGGSDSRHIAKEHEFVVTYSKNINTLPEMFERHNENYLKRYREEDDYGRYFWDTLARPGLKNPINYDIVTENGDIINGDWIWSKVRFEEARKENKVRIIKKKNGEYSVHFKQYLNLKGKKPRSMTSDFGGTFEGKKEVTEIFNSDKIFSYPKSTKQIKKLIEFTQIKKGLILDFFSGSGSSSHAVMSLNAEDGGDRKCISVQLPEPTDEKSEAYKAGYTTIAEITKERIRRAGELIKKEHKDKVGIDKLDVGFRVFKLDSSNIKAWDTSVENFEEQLDMFAQNNGENIKQDRTEEDILFEILLKYGLELTVPIIEKEIAGNKVYNIGFGSMYICLEDKVNPEVAKGIGEWHKQEFTDNNPSVIFKDAGFANDADKTNTVQTLKQFGISNVKSI